ncbi:DUF4386 domain-containing protein [Arenibacter sp. S6351L]|uniref:DUF4386 domain-containing protein n=1 Tax=Arenibacter sp. S6351L TaxID=2926407 RepID=UPI001FF5FA22|nr:DUF4386 domain-containing protein [Arenibacter sp. S6351L]MCK0136111.1 DUF4386 domain-containing protein [Arenibacter sp. S6351L]
MTIKNKQISRIAGALILLGMITGILSIVPSVESDKFLEDVFPNKVQVLTAAIFQFCLVPIYVGFSLILYPILRRYNKSLSLGFVGFRFVSATFQLIGIILLPLFVFLSQEYSIVNSMDPAIYETAGDGLRLFRDLTNHLGVILATGMGNMLFYLILYKEKLVPYWLSFWGFSGNIVIMIASFLIIFQIIKVISIAYGLMTIPLIFQELVLAILLLTKGLTIKTNPHLLS